MNNRDVIWITLESVRQDHTSLGNHHRDTTPNLDQFGTQGYTSNKCFSHDIWTRSSSASILTGHPPSAHQTWSYDAKLPEEIKTIPEAFSEAGYLTACISPNPHLSPSTGLDRGFDQFHYLNKSTLLKEAGLGAFTKWLLNFRRHTGGLTLDGNQHCIGYLSNSISKRYIDETVNCDEPLFLYLHHGDSHHAYVPPIAWRDHFAEDLPIPVNDAIDLALKMNKRLHEFIAQGVPFSDDEWQTLRVLYDTSLAYVDHLTGTLIKYARRRLEDPIVVITADHGELFGERGLLAHMLVTNTAVSNVPLAIIGLDDLPDGGLIQHADVMQMLCTDLGIDHSVPIGQDIRERPREFTVTQRGGDRAQDNLKKIREHNDTFPIETFHNYDLTSLRTEEWRYQTSKTRTDLFNLKDETNDVSGERSKVVSYFNELYQTWIGDVGQPIGKAGSAEFDERQEDHLRDLGYL